MATTTSEITSKPPKRTYSRLKSRLKDAGFHSKFVERALVPSWWDEECKKELLGDFEFEVARFLGVPIEVVRDTQADLVIPPTGARLRAPKGTDTASMSASIFAAQEIAKAVVRNLSSAVPDFAPSAFPSNPLDLRERMPLVTFPHLLNYLWDHGVPVITVEELPKKKFKALACWAINRPVIVIGQKDDDHAKTLVNLAHEASHIGCGHVQADSFIVEGDSESEDNDTDIEREAWAYYHRLTMGTASSSWRAGAPQKGTDPSTALILLTRVAKEYSIDQSLLVHLWATSNQDFKMRAKLLYKLDTARGAQSAIKRRTRKSLNLEDVSRTDEALLQACLP